MHQDTVPLLSLAQENAKTSYNSMSLAAFPGSDHAEIDITTGQDIVVNIIRLGPEGSVLKQTSASAFNNLLFAINVLAQAKIIAMVSSDAAGGLTSTFQNALMSAFTGCLLSVGIEMGAPIGAAIAELDRGVSANTIEIKKCYREAGEVAKSGLLLSIVFGGIASGLMCLTVPIFPYIADEQTATAASRFFLGSAIGAIPTVLARTIPQIAFQAGDWSIFIGSGILCYIPSIGMSYVLAGHGNMGPFGVGLGNSLVAWLSYAVLQFWLRKERYHDLNLFDFAFPERLKKMSLLIKRGWELALQRLAEWGNIAVITAILGALDHKSLVAINPSLQYTAIFVLGMQGFAQGCGMLIKKNSGIIKQAITNEAFNHAEIARLNTKNILIRNNILGLIISGVGVGAIYLAREPLCKFYLPSDADEETEKLAQLCLLIAMLGMLPDATRAICLGSLRGWEQVLMPTLFSILIMTIIGIPLAYGFSRLWDHDSETFLGTRAVTMLIAAFVAAKQCYNQLSTQHKMILTSSGSNPSALFSDSKNRRLSSSYSRSLPRQDANIQDIPSEDKTDKQLRT